MPDLDVIVIGAGPAGEVLAGRTAAAGLSTAIVEERLVGGGLAVQAVLDNRDSIISDLDDACARL